MDPTLPDPTHNDIMSDNGMFQPWWTKFICVGCRFDFIRADCRHQISTRLPFQNNYPSRFDPIVYIYHLSASARWWPGLFYKSWWYSGWSRLWRNIASLSPWFRAADGHFRVFQGEKEASCKICTAGLAWNSQTSERNGKLESGKNNFVLTYVFMHECICMGLLQP